MNSYVSEQVVIKKSGHSMKREIILLGNNVYSLCPIKEVCTCLINLMHWNNVWATITKLKIVVFPELGFSLSNSVSHFFRTIVTQGPKLKGRRRIFSFLSYKFSSSLKFLLQYL